MAIHHPDPLTALVLPVPLTYKAPTQADSAPPLPPWIGHDDEVRAAIGKLLVPLSQP